MESEFKSEQLGETKGLSRLISSEPDKPVPTQVQQTDEAELGEIRRKYAAAQIAAARANSRFTSAGRQLLELRQELELARKAQEKDQNELAILQKANRTLEQEVIQLRTTIEQYQLDLADRQRKFHKSERNAEQSSTALKQAQVEISLLRQSLQQKENQYNLVVKSPVYRQLKAAASLVYRIPGLRRSR